MNVLVYGPRGFVGKHLVSRLQRDGHSVTEAGRDFPLIPDLADDEFARPDIIINCAGEITTKHLMYESNIALVHKILLFAQRVNVSKVVHIGSSSEYGNLSLPRQETALCTPNDLYGGTKLAATALCQGFATEGLDVVIARPFSLYGPGDKPRKLIPRLIQSACTGDEVKVSIGSQHDFTYIDDFVGGLITLMHAPADKTRGDIVNFGTGVGSSNQDVIATLGSLGAHPNVSYVEGSLGACKDVPRWVADTTKAAMRYGWEARTSLREGLAKIVS